MCHCPGIMNPVDLFSRGWLADQLINCDLWLNGPNFLGKQINFYNYTVSPSTKIPIALFFEFKENVNCLILFNLNINLARFRTFVFARHVMAYFMRFVNKQNGPLNSEELELADLNIFIHSKESLFL